MSSPPPEKPPQNPPGKRPPNRRAEGDEAPRPGFSSGWLILIVLFGFLLIYMYQQNPQNTGQTVDYSFFLEQVKEENIAEVTFHGDVLTGKWKTPPANPEAGSNLMFHHILEKNARLTPGQCERARAALIELRADWLHPWRN